MASDRYQDLLNRAREDIPDDLTSGERFQVPEVDIFYEGKSTVVKNFGDILDRLNRSSDHALPRLLRELGTAGDLEDGRLTLQGRMNAGKINDRIESYVEAFVICSECGRPDTHLDREGRTVIVKCDACGGHRPVKARKRQQAPDKPKEAVEEGGIYEVKIEDTGKKGDGVTHLDKYTVFVNGAAEGLAYKIKVNKVTGTLAFADIVEQIEDPTAE